MRPVARHRAHHADERMLDATIGHRGVAPVMASLPESNLAVGRSADVDAHVAWAPPVSHRG